MTIARWLVPAGALVLCVGLFVSPGQAAPLSGAAADALKADGSEYTAVEKAHGRRHCWRHRGHWHCPRYVRRWHHPYYYHGGYYPRRSYYYRSRPGFAIYAPGFGLYIAPRYKRRWY